MILSSITSSKLSLGNRSNLCTSFKSMLDGVAEGKIPTLDSLKETLFNSDVYTLAQTVAALIGFGLELSSTLDNKSIVKFKGGDTFKNFKGIKNGSMKSVIGMIPAGFTLEDEYVVLLYDGIKSAIVKSSDCELTYSTANFEDLYIKLLVRCRAKTYLDDIDYFDLFGMLQDLLDALKSILNLFKFEELPSLDLIHNMCISTRLPNFFIEGTGIGKELAKTEADDSLEDYYLSKEADFDYSQLYKSSGYMACMFDENKKDVIMCYQTPTGISYTAQGQYDDVSPRGSQQPFRYYKNASAVELNFTLAFHKCDSLKFQGSFEEVDGRVSSKSEYSIKELNLQEIAKKATSLTRPWKRSDTSLKPKIVYVMLPGIVAKGYLSSASISYDGDIYGDNSFGKESRTTNLQYGSNNVASTFGSLSISFSLSVIEEINLRSTSSSKATSDSKTEPKTENDGTGPNICDNSKEASITEHNAAVVDPDGDILASYF